MESLYTDNLALAEKSLDEVMGKYEGWKMVLDEKSQRLIVEKTKVLHLLYSKKAYAAKADPCGVFGEQVGCNSFQYIRCQKWVYYHYLDVPKWVGLPQFRDVLVCWTCLFDKCSLNKEIECKRVEEEVEQFCDMFNSYSKEFEAIMEEYVVPE